MSKVGSSYPSVVLGVSEQVPQDRRPGQHSEQINFISDPVRGLARRWGSRWMAEQLVQSGQVSSFAAEFAKMREFSFTIDGHEYCVFYRTQASLSGPTTFMFCYDKDNNRFIPVNINYVGSAGGQQAALVDGGVSAITCVGRYLYVAGNNIRPTYTQSTPWAAVSNAQRFAAWVRSGSYSRTYTIRLTRPNGTQVVGSYTTKASAYPVLNDTSGIAIPSGTDGFQQYQKAINDANNLYNSKVTEWIGIAARDITPENIAEQLILALRTAGVPPLEISRVGGTVIIDTAGFADISCDDGGDGTTMIGVGQEVSSVDKLSTIHYVGKVVRVRPRGAQAKESYYVQAFAKNASGSGWQEVIWREAAGVVNTPASMFSFGVIVDNVLYLRATPTELATIPGSGTHPPFKANEVGDAASCPIPNFFGKTITMLGSFQDRLIIGSEGVVSCSRNGDYLNMFRQTVLDLRDNDPLEMYAYGAEGDILRSTTLFDKDLVIFGDQKQYSVSGRTVLTPKTPNIAVMSSHEDSTQAYPVANGNLIFYAKEREGRTSAHQFQVGQLTEAPESYEISQQLDTYIKGRPAQIVPLTSPNTLVLRTEIPGNSFYVYNYADSPAGTERLFDSWATWKYADILGVICSVSAHNGELLIFTARQSPVGGGYIILVADRQSLSTELSPRPYMDSLRYHADASSDGWYAGMPREPISAAIGKGHSAFLFGDTWANIGSLLTQLPGSSPYTWVGVPTPATVTPTNPYMRDSNGKAITEGRLTLTYVTASFADSAGMTGAVSTSNGSTMKDMHIERVLGKHNNVIGVQPIVTGSVKLSVGRETRECSYSVGTITWQPLTITGLSWVGQSFNRIRRAG